MRRPCFERVLSVSWPEDGVIDGVPYRVNGKSDGNPLGRYAKIVLIEHDQQGRKDTTQRAKPPALKAHKTAGALLSTFLP